MYIKILFSPKHQNGIIMWMRQGRIEMVTKEVEAPKRKEAIDRSPGPLRLDLPGLTVQRRRSFAPSD